VGSTEILGDEQKLPFFAGCQIGREEWSEHGIGFDIAIKDIDQLAEWGIATSLVV
jgi:hypothetical protein